MKKRSNSSFFLFPIQIPSFSSIKLYNLLSIVQKLLIHREPEPVRAYTFPDQNISQPQFHGLAVFSLLNHIEKCPVPLLIQGFLRMPELKYVCNSRFCQVASQYLTLPEFL